MKCDFCEGYENIIINSRKINRVLLETESFYVIPTIGSFVEGYLLIISKKHILSMGCLLSDEYYELSKIIIVLRNFFKKYYNCEAIVFEHGTGSVTDASSASVVHAHTHVIPTNSSIMNQIENHFGKDNITRIRDIKRLSEYGASHRSYLYYQDINSQQYIIDDFLCTSQILRKFIYEELNKDRWDWRLYPEYENLLKTINKVSKSELNEQYNKMKCRRPAMKSQP